jgi:3-hydroxyisobutyrate dehydrogenase
MNSSNAQTVGFVGLGNMGLHMAKNVLKKTDHKVVAFDLNSAAVDSLVSSGNAQRAGSPAEVAAASDLVVTMLPSNPHVLKVYLDPKTGMLTQAKPGSLFIDCSTVEPAISQQVAAAATEHGCRLVDAPVSGGTIGAEQATLTFMVGAATEDSFKDAEALLQHLGKKVVHCGDVGMGQAAKLCNNLVLGISMAAVCEGHVLGGRLGLDPKVLADILNTSSGRCWSSDTYNPCPGVMEGVPSARGYTGGFACDLMVKDLGLATAAAQNSKPRLGLPMGGLAHQLYMMMSAHGSGTKDFSALYEFLNESPKQA